MSEKTEDPCDECMYRFDRFETLCPRRKCLRWERSYFFIRPDPKTGKFDETAKEKLASKGLAAITADNSFGVIPKGDDRVLLIHRDEEGKITKPFGNTLVKEVGYFWSHTSKEWDIPTDEFPLLPPDKAINKFLFECFSAKMSDKDMRDKLTAEHPEWIATLTNSKAKLISRQARECEPSNIMQKTLFCRQCYYAKYARYKHFWIAIKQVAIYTRSLT